MKRLRLWLIDFLVGDMSYMKNCAINGIVSLRDDHFITGNVFVNNSYAHTGSGARFPELKSNEASNAK